jgi:hypothetical protein
VPDHELGKPSPIRPAGFLLEPYQPLQLIAKACRIMNPK